MCPPTLHFWQVTFFLLRTSFQLSTLPFMLFWLPGLGYLLSRGHPSTLTTIRLLSKRDCWRVVICILGADCSTGGRGALVSPSGPPVLPADIRFRLGFARCTLSLNRKIKAASATYPASYPPRRRRPEYAATFRHGFRTRTIVVS